MYIRGAVCAVSMAKKNPKALRSSYPNMGSAYAFPREWRALQTLSEHKGVSSAWAELPQLSSLFPRFWGEIGKDRFSP